MCVPVCLCGTDEPFFVDVSRSKEIHPFDHDYVVWLGDLNYRIDSSLSVEAVNELVDKVCVCVRARESE